MINNRLNTVIILFLLTMTFISCKKDSNNKPVPIVNPTVGTYNRSYVSTLSGFFEQRPSLLESTGVSVAEFNRISVDSSWGLSVEERTKLKSIRDQVSFPTHKTLLQKAVTLYDMENYISNKYGGTIGGFICVAGDVKSLQTLRDIYWGLRFDYDGTYWDTTGTGYAVIRFTANCVNSLYIPYSPEMGGTYEHSWPNTGGGFSASTLGNGGFPEYVFTGYHSPNEGSEIYSVTANGQETLVATFTDNQWTAINEPAKSISVNPIKNGIYARHHENLYETVSLQNGTYKIIGNETINREDVDFVQVSTFASYQGETFYVRGCDNTYYYLTTTSQTIQQKLHLKPVEKGLFGITVPKNDIMRIWETVSEL